MPALAAARRACDSPNDIETGGRAVTGTVSHAICAGMEQLGIDALFCLPGIQNDDFFNVLFDFPGLRPFVTRHEQACAYMAAGAAQASGRPAAYCVVPGQGVLNAAAGHATAYATAARVLAVVGQSKSPYIGAMHGLLHELPDQMAVLGQISKSAAALRDARAAGGEVATALSAVAGGHPKPVTVECPLDLWAARTEAPTPPAPAFPEVDEDAIARAADLLAAADAPMIVLGGGAHDAADAVAELADMLKCPVSALRQGKGAYDERRPLAVPGPVAHELWKDVDVALGVGTRFQTHEMQWGVDDALKLIQIEADPEELNRRGRIDVPIHAMTQHALPKLIEALRPRLGRREDRSDDLAARTAAFRDKVREKLTPTIDDLEVIGDVLGEDGIFVDDLTQVAYAARFLHRAPRPRSYVCAGYAGTLGWGLPAGLGAQVACPGRRVLVVQGDGGFGYGAMELATAVKYDLPVVTLVYNDSAYGNVQRIQQQRFGHNRTIATDLVNPDIHRFAETFGALGLRAEPGPEGLRAALETAFAAGRPAVVEAPTPERYPSPWRWIQLPTVRGPQQPNVLVAD
jgi:acetolactate synthase-1/2/3 large subunit